MTDAREIISNAIAQARHDEHPNWSRFIMQRLTSAGFRILGPEEIDGPTVEKCAEVADSLSETWSNSHDAFQTVQEASASDKAFEIAAAIRALQEKRT